MNTVFHKFSVFLWNLQREINKWWANSKITQMWFFCVITSSWLVFAWPPNLSWWNPDYSDGSYVTAIVSSGCSSEDGAPPRIASFACLAPRRLGPRYVLWSALTVWGYGDWRSHTSLFILFTSCHWVEMFFPEDSTESWTVAEIFPLKKALTFVNKSTCRAHLMFDKNVTLCM